MQNRWQWVIWCRVPDEALTVWRGRCHQEGPPGQKIQGQS